MARYILLLCLGISLFFALPSFAETASLGALRIQEGESSTALLINSDKQLTFKLFTLTAPDRVVLDLENTRAPRKLPQTKNNHFITAIRTAEKEKQTLRIVLDTKNKPFDVKATTLLPNSSGQYQLQLRITHAPSSFEEMIELALQDNTPIPRPNPTSSFKNISPSNTPTPTLRPQKSYKPIIIIDAGHGGHDPGSIGKRGTKEKTITLAFARELYKQLKTKKKYRPILTRSKDRYLRLRERVSIARKYKADLFISLHADSHNNPRIKGMSVYTLSDKASDKEAAALARKENKSDIITGIDFKHEDRDITNVLVSIAQRDTMNQSALFAERVVQSVQSEITLLRNPHRFAGFRVLTAADVPSVLVELGYLSNRREEKLLNSEKHKKKLVQVLIRAINTHF